LFGIPTMALSGSQLGGHSATYRSWNTPNRLLVYYFAGGGTFHLANVSRVALYP
jgi:hypothetical protein